MPNIKKIKLPNDTQSRVIVDEQAVHFNESQTLTELQKTTARNNIQAIGSTDSSLSTHVPVIADKLSGITDYIPGQVPVVNTVDSEGNPLSWRVKNTYVIKNTLDSTLISGVSYDLGTKTSLTLQLPSSGESLDEIYVAFISGNSPTNLVINGSYMGDKTYSPAINCIVELCFKYVCSYWVLVIKETNINV